VLVSQRKQAAAEAFAVQLTARAEQLQLRMTTDPAARAEYAAFLGVTLDLLRRAPRARGWQREQHTAMIAAAVRQIEDQRKTLLEPVRESAV